MGNYGKSERDEWIDEHYDPTTDGFDEEMPEEYKIDPDDWDDDTPSDTWHERNSWWFNILKVITMLKNNFC